MAGNKSFAHGLLTRHGWSEGKGLGRDESGRAEALKVKLKFDKNGLGENGTSQWTFNWWDHIYNKTALNIDIEDEEDGVKVKSKNKTREKVAISAKRPETREKKLFYGYFVKASESDEAVKSEADADDTRDYSKKYTEEELLKATGGLTGHKGARHGINMSEKLKRIEQADREFMEKYRNGQAAPPMTKPVPEFNEVPEKAKKSKSKKTQLSVQVVEPSNEEPNEPKKMRKEHKKMKKQATCPVGNADGVDPVDLAAANVMEPVAEAKGKKRKRATLAEAAVDEMTSRKDHKRRKAEAEHLSPEECERRRSKTKRRHANTQ